MLLRVPSIRREDSVGCGRPAPRDAAKGLQVLGLRGAVNGLNLLDAEHRHFELRFKIGAFEGRAGCELPSKPFIPIVRTIWQRIRN
jgi:hypothetical protein